MLEVPKLLVDVQNRGIRGSTEVIDPVTTATYLYGAIVSNHLVLHLITPQTSLCQVLQQVVVDNL